MTSAQGLGKSQRHFTSKIFLFNDLRSETSAQLKAKRFQGFPPKVGRSGLMGEITCRYIAIDQKRLFKRQIQRVVLRFYQDHVPFTQSYGYRGVF